MVQLTGQEIIGAVIGAVVGLVLSFLAQLGFGPTIVVCAFLGYAVGSFFNDD